MNPSPSRPFRPTDRAPLATGRRVALACLLGTLAVRPAHAQSLDACRAAADSRSADAWLSAARASMEVPDDGVFHFWSMGTQSMDFQSDRTYPPFFSALQSAESWYDPRTGVQRESFTGVFPKTGPGEPRTAVTDARTTWVEVEGQLREAASFHAAMAPQREMNPWAVLLDWSRASDVRVAGVCDYRDLPRIVLSRGGAFGPDRLFLDLATALPVKLERIRPHATWGQRHEEILWSTWIATGDGGYFPSAAHQLEDGGIQRERTLGRMEILPRSRSPIPEVPAEAARATEDVFLAAWSAQPPDTVRQSDHVVVLADQAYNETLVQVGDTVYVLDATLSEKRARQDSALAATLFPDAPNRVVVVTDLAWPHIGGVRFWVARGATVVAHRSARDFLTRLVERRWTHTPDALERVRAGASVPFRFVGVDDGLDLAGGKLRLRTIGGRAAFGALLAYVPDDAFLWAGDWIQTTSAQSLYATDVAAAVARAGFEPRRFAAQHVAPGEWAPVAALNPVPDVLRADPFR